LYGYTFDQQDIIQQLSVLNKWLVRLCG